MVYKIIFGNDITIQFIWSKLVLSSHHYNCPKEKMPFGIIRSPWWALKEMCKNKVPFLLKNAISFSPSFNFFICSFYSFSFVSGDKKCKLMYVIMHSLNMAVSRIFLALLLYCSGKLWQKILRGKWMKDQLVAWH